MHIYVPELVKNAPMAIVRKKWAIEETKPKNRYDVFRIVENDGAMFIQMDDFPTSKASSRLMDIESIEKSCNQNEVRKSLNEISADFLLDKPDIKAIKNAKLMKRYANNISIARLSATLGM